MLGIEYQRLAMRTNDKMNMERLDAFIYNYEDSEIDVGGLINACLGLSGEVGELNDMVKKWIFHASDMDYTHLAKEVGDVLWYVAMFCESMGWDIETIMKLNIEKLKARYPEGFDVELSAHREEGDV